MTQHPIGILSSFIITKQSRLSDFMILAFLNQKFNIRELLKLHNDIHFHKPIDYSKVFPVWNSKEEPFPFTLNAYMHKGIPTSKKYKEYKYTYLPCRFDCTFIITSIDNNYYYTAFNPSDIVACVQRVADSQGMDTKSLIHEYLSQGNDWQISAKWDLIPSSDSYSQILNLLLHMDEEADKIQLFSNKEHSS